MMKFFALMTLCFALFSVAACQTTSLTNPCDVLVRIDPLPASNTFLIANDRQAAIGIAQHRGRYKQYECGKN